MFNTGFPQHSTIYLTIIRWLEIRESLGEQQGITVHTYIKFQTITFSSGFLLNLIFKNFSHKIPTQTNFFFDVNE